MHTTCLGKVQRHDHGQITLCGKSGSSGLIPDAFSLGKSIVLMNLCRGSRCEWINCLKVLHTVDALFELFL